jgi:(p)ppGpp synthase/HD superfamily hydrolase
MTHLITDRFADAFRYATEAHLKQIRKGSKVAYISHPMAVASLVIEFGGTEDEAMGGLLHDVVEDCGSEHEGVIAEKFGDNVRAIVMGCTDGTQEEKARPKDREARVELWHQRKQAYIAHLDTATPSTLLVSCCDKLHNAQSCVRDLRNVGLEVYDRFLGGVEGTLWYYHALAETFGRLGVVPAKELQRVVDTLASETRALQMSAGRKVSP